MMITVEPPSIVAELSCNHEGSVDKAINLVWAAKGAKADAIKIQYYNSDDMVSGNPYIGHNGTPWDGANLKDLYIKGSTSHYMTERMFREARLADIPIFASVFSLRGLEALEKLGCPWYKIASFENNDYKLISEVSSTGKPIIVSTGMCTYRQIERIVDTVADKNLLTLMHCISAYPTNFNEANIENILHIQTIHDKVGFSDHTTTNEAAMAATVLGATIIEKHLIHSHSKDSLDKQHSINEYEFSNYVGSIKKIHRTLRANYNPEGPYRQFKRSLYVIKDIKQGEEFTHDNIRAMRPYLGLDPFCLPLIIGQKADKDYKAGTPYKTPIKDVKND